jgi:hypothetical protein
MGWFGRLFGPAPNAPIGIAGFIALLFAFASVVVLFVPANMAAKDYVDTVLPVISVMVGYLFGKNT